MSDDQKQPSTPTVNPPESTGAATEPATFVAVGRLREKLQAKGFDEAAVSFILGRFVNKVANTMLDEVVEALSDVVASPEVGGIADDAQRQAKIEALFKERTGKTIHQRREEVADSMVAEFEKAGVTPQ